jgi:hypothetical protein
LLGTIAVQKPGKWPLDFKDIRVSLVFVMAFQLAGCAGGEPGEQAAGAGSTSTAAAPDACAIVTAADIEQVLGVAAKVQPGDRLQTIAATSLCSYEDTQDSSHVLSVLVRVGPAALDAATNLKQYVEGLKMNMGEDYPIDPVEGLSGPAVWNPGMRQLTVFRGPSLLILTMPETGGKEPLEAAKALGEKGLPRM